MPRRPSASIRLIEGFDDPSIDREHWRRVLQGGQTDTVFLTRWWQKTWWDVFGRGQLLLLGVFQKDELIGIAPLFADGGMIFFVGSGGSDYLDFVGEILDPDLLARVLARAVKLVPSFVGFRFYHVPDESNTGSVLDLAAESLGMICYEEGGLPAPAIDLDVSGIQIAHKKKLLRYQRILERDGVLSVQHFTDGIDILPRLETFFEQHITRWSETPYPSQFLDLSQRQFYGALCRAVGHDSWLRFSEVCWNGMPIAYHFGFSYGPIYTYYKPSFDVEFARLSPGMVLLRNVLLEAVSQGSSVFDLGLGDETYKKRFANIRRSVRNWGIYPADQTQGTFANHVGVQI